MFTTLKLKQVVAALVVAATDAGPLVMNLSPAVQPAKL